MPRSTAALEYSEGSTPTRIVRNMFRLLMAAGVVKFRFKQLNHPLLSLLQATCQTISYPRLSQATTINARVFSTKRSKHNSFSHSDRQLSLLGQSMPRHARAHLS